MYYNQATTNFAFHFNETSQDKLPIIYIIVIQVHAKLLKNFFISPCIETLKIVEKFVKKKFVVKHAHLLNWPMLYAHIGIASMSQFQCFPKIYATEIKKPILKYTLNK